MRTVIAIVTITALLAVAGAIVVGKRSFDGTVVEKPYDRGLMWDQERRAREESGLAIKIRGSAFKVGDNDLMLSLSDRHSNPVADARVRMTVGRPATNKYNKIYELDAKGDGTYSTVVSLSLYGNWNADISVIRKGQEILFSEKIFAEK